MAGRSFFLAFLTSQRLFALNPRREERAFPPPCSGGADNRDRTRKIGGRERREEEDNHQAPRPDGKAGIVEEVGSEDAHEEDPEVAEDESTDEVVEEGHVRHARDKAQGVVRKKGRVYIIGMTAFLPRVITLEFLGALFPGNPFHDPFSAQSSDEEHQGRKSGRPSWRKGRK